MLRVLVTDDSPTVRALLVAVLKSDPAIEVVGEAQDGGEAIALTQKLRPDLITMDVVMPGVDGFEATRRIMIELPTPIVLVSAVTEGAGAASAMHALRAGALTVLPKSPGPSSPDFDDWCRHFLSTIKAMAQVKLVRRSGRKAPRAPEPAASRAVRVVAVGASTGGPAALHRILGDLPADFPVPILVVQHLADGFVQELAGWLNRASLLRVVVAAAGARLAPGTVYLAPDHGHLALLDRTTIGITSADPVGGFRPSATYLFESVARVFGAASLGVILTGMGSDGASGLVSMRRAGARVVAQDEESSVVYGMPRAAVEAGAVDTSVSLAAMASSWCGIVNDHRPMEGDG